MRRSRPLAARDARREPGWNRSAARRQLSPQRRALHRGPAVRRRGRGAARVPPLLRRHGGATVRARGAPGPGGAGASLPSRDERSAPARGDRHRGAHVARSPRGARVRTRAGGLRRERRGPARARPRRPLPPRRGRARARPQGQPGAALRIRHDAGHRPSPRRSAACGHRRGEGGVTGILLVDKPEGMTSAGVIRALKPRLGRTKVGHLGTLDPFASGLLPLCLGEATKVARWLLLEDKAYEGTIRLGTATDTLDRTGTVVGNAPVPPLEQRMVDEPAGRFAGRPQQVPPMSSALKRAGVPLYELARRGIEVEREPRDIEIRWLVLAAR